MRRVATLSSAYARAGRNPEASGRDHLHVKGSAPVFAVASGIKSPLDHWSIDAVQKNRHAAACSHADNSARTEG
jgi:hypothetical protein